MNLLALDTATEQCSVALITPSQTWTRSVATARGHADLILGMIDEVLTESGISKKQINALAFGRGPGSFTGVRIAVSVAQGLAFALQVPVAGISNLAAVAQQVANAHHLSSGARILVCMDARMQEVYWAIYQVIDGGVVSLYGLEQVGAPGSVEFDVADIKFAAGTGFRAYPQLRERFAHVAMAIDDAALPRAQDVAQLALIEIAAGRGVQAADAQPVYLRDQIVAAPKTGPLKL